MGKKNTGEPTEVKRFESKYDAKSLRDSIQEGLDAKAIMERLGVRHKQTLKQYVLRLISDDRAFYEVKGLYLKSSAHPRVNAKGELKLILRNLDLGDLIVAAGDEFAVTAEDNRIILTRI